jgi:hypothetical protein
MSLKLALSIFVVLCLLVTFFSTFYIAIEFAGASYFERILHFRTPIRKGFLYCSLLFNVLAFLVLVLIAFKT